MHPRHVCAALIAACVLSSAAAFGCDHCGCVAQCQKTCRLVCETKKVDVVCWGCKCEDFCVPGPSKPCCKHCEMVCDDCEQCNKDGVHYQPHKFVWTEWIPGCAKIHTRKKLMKKTITKTIPSYKWVVENLCPQCQAHAQSVAVPAGTELPQLPAYAASTTVMPVGTLPPGVQPAGVVPDVITEISEDGTQVKAASFAVPLPQQPAARPVVPVQKSWSDNVKTLWQR